MAGKPRRAKPASLPSRQQLLDYLADNPGRISKREIARAFRVGAEDRARLKQMLRELEDEGAILRGRGKNLRTPGTLPAVTVVEMIGTDADGEALARPISWDEATSGPPPTIYLARQRRAGVALGRGERALVRLTRAATEASYSAKIMRRVGFGPDRLMGIIEISGDGGWLRPIEKRQRHDYRIAKGDMAGAKPGELVRAEAVAGRGAGPRRARVVERLGSSDEARSVSLIAILAHGLPTEFSAEALDQAAAATPVVLGERSDLRGTPLITIDGSDARDFDDAVWAEPDPDPSNPGGWHILVAIADVAHYVRPGDALDICARERGNSAYFADRVVPMLPEALSNDLCSLRPDEDRACLAVHLYTGADGTPRGHRFVRALMRSAARLTYEEAQAAHDGKAGESEALDPARAKSIAPLIAPLYGAYRALLAARVARGALEIDLPERRIELDDAGNVRAISVRERLDSHRLIEEFMIAANVAAATALEDKRVACLYRVHEPPDPAKVDALREFVATLGLTLARGQVVRPAMFNALLARAGAIDSPEMVHELVLRTQTQAYYGPTNLGHFGLGLRRYAHFTSPIRRYADLLVHRGLIRAFGLGPDRLSDDEASALAEIGKAISDTERRAAVAERETVDRYVSAFMTDRVGAIFGGRITSVTRFGLFVVLDESGADGLVPIKTLPRDYYEHDERGQRLVGRSTGREYRLGERVEVRLREANATTGGLLLELCDSGAQNERRPAAGPARGTARRARRAARR